MPRPRIPDIDCQHLATLQRRVALLVLLCIGGAGAVPSQGRSIEQGIERWFAARAEHVGTVLPNGTYMLGASCANPPLDALLNAATLAWSSTGAPNTKQNQQGYTLLQSGKVLTIDVWDPPAAQQYDPGTGLWTSIASTPASLVDPAACGNYALGPAVTRPDGTMVAFGGNTGCATAPSPTDPTAIYTPSSNSWIAGPNLPAVCGSNGTTSCSLANAPAAMLPNGNILIAASAGFASAPTHFFEFTSTNAINQVADDVFFASTSGAYYYNFLVLPNGQVLATDTSAYVEIYSPTGSANSSLGPGHHLRGKLRSSRCLLRPQWQPAQRAVARGGIRR